MQLRNVAVFGAGTMGSGIAQKVASAKVPVTLIDATLERAQAGRERIKKTLEEGVARKLFTADDVTAILSRITPAGEASAAKDADLVIEAVFEDLETKRALFKTLSAVCRPDAVLATNTSSFLVRELAAVTSHPERVFGLHYFYHPAKNRLVEVIPHEGSDPALVRRAFAEQEALGKTPIASADAPGFVVNRFFVPWLNEAVRLLEEGVGIATIESVAKESFGIGMGPFELMNVTGVPIAEHAAGGLAKELGAFYAPAAALRAQVASGKPWDLSGSVDTSAAERVRERLWGVVYYVAGALVSEKVGTLEDTDLGARVGLRWPKGPFEAANRLGTAKARALAESIAARYQLELPALWRQQGDKPFALARVTLTVLDGLGIVKVNRPDQLNALDPDTVKDLGARFDEAAALKDVRAIVLMGAGKAFVAGADVKYFVERQAQNDIRAIVDFAAYGQQVFRRIERCDKRVVCALDGLALGGGAELALACHVIVATPRARMGFPETGLGIYPGLGGTQRLTRRLGKGLARLFLYTGNTLGAEELATYNLAHKVVAPDELMGAVRAAAEQAPVQAKVDATRLPPDVAYLAKFLSDANAQGLADGSLTLPGGQAVADAVKRIRRKAPLAVVAVERLTELATTGDLDQGLAAETDGLFAVFDSTDGREGMRAVLERRPPVFKGA